MATIPKIKLYGAKGCHKTRYYQLLLDETKLPYEFLDVEANLEYAKELRGLYESSKLNFPTITIGTKKLRNPCKEDLHKWMNILITSRSQLIHDRENQRFVMDINIEIAKVEYQFRDEKFYLVHSEVPFQLRGKGIGKVLVEKTFEKLNADGFKAIAVCSYIKAIAQRSTKWASIIG